MQRYKFQALVTPNADDDGDARAKLSSGSHRMVLRAVNSETHRSQVFSALVDGEDDGPFRAGSPQIMVTLRVVGDDVADYLEIGSQFQLLWLGAISRAGWFVTRRLYPSGFRERDLVTVRSLMMAITRRPTVEAADRTR